MRKPSWEESWIEWVPALLKKLVTSYGGGVARVADRMDTTPYHVRTFAGGKPSSPTLKTMIKFASLFQQPIIIFPESWDLNRKLRWLEDAHGKCGTSNDGN